MRKKIVVFFFCLVLGFLFFGVLGGFCLSTFYGKTKVKDSIYTLGNKLKTDFRISNYYS